MIKCVENRVCRRCRLPLSSPGTPVCLHTKVSDAEFASAERGIAARQLADAKAGA